MIKLLAVDLDDTLLTHALKIPQANKAALSRARSLGVEVVLASGRTLFSMEPYARELSMFGSAGFMIASNGSQIFDTRDNRLIYKKTVEPEAAARAYEIVCAYGLTMQYYGHGVIYSSGMSKYTQLDCRLTGQSLEIDGDFQHRLADRSKFVIPGEPEMLLRVQDDLKTELGGRCNIFTSKPFFLEILPGDADKGAALAYVAEYHGFVQDEVMAVGDSMNDYGMISWAGTGVAMSNGLEAVHAIANAVTPLSNEENGVAWAVEEYILKLHDAVK